ncbi:MAG: energy transducer TonB [Sphingomicrobium sp.]
MSDDPEFMSKFSAASAVEITHDRIGTFRAPVRWASAAAYALRNCEDRKMQEWGIDPAMWRGLKVHPVPLKPTNWVRADEYPRKALKHGLRGWGIARLEVDPDGRIKACTSINRDLYREFSDTVCNALKRRARFQPARDSNDRAVAAPYVVIVRFQTP